MCEEVVRQFTVVKDTGFYLRKKIKYKSGFGKDNDLCMEVMHSV